jgi:hypothetical protein
MPRRQLLNADYMESIFAGGSTPMPFAGDKEFGVNFTDAGTCAGYQDRLTD